MSKPFRHAPDIKSNRTRSYDCYNWIIYDHPTLNGKLHREDGPAAEYDSGLLIWYQYGKRHREDGPAFVHPDGSEEWYRYGDSHRIGGPAVIDTDTSYGPIQEWWEYGKLHRVGAPAVIRGVEGSQQFLWYRLGDLHRTDGPAIINDDAEPRCKWYLNGEQIRSPEEFERRARLSNEEMAFLILKYGDF